MTQEIGLQYAKDHTIDKSGFLAKARLHQSKFRAIYLNVPFDTYGNYLTKQDAEAGLNFYSGFDIFQAVKKRYPNYNKQLLANMLRSEHIPFNLIIPLKSNLDYCKQVFNHLMNSQINSIDRIEVEYAPSPSEKYLDDKTSFDIYIEYTHQDQKKGIIGIEVKYTEQGYKLKSGSKQARMIEDKNSRYYTISRKSQLYHSSVYEHLVTDTYRQIWRNQLLGESMLLTPDNDVKHFTSMIIYPEGNVHIREASAKYEDMLVQNDGRFLTVTFEEFIAVCRTFALNDRFGKWLDYLERRYLVDFL